MANKLRRLRLNRCDLVDRPANPLAHVVLYKRAVSWAEFDKSVLPSPTRTSLPDSAFAAAWTDGEGRKQQEKHMNKSIREKLVSFGKAAGALVDWAQQEETEAEHAEKSPSSPIAMFCDKLASALSAYGNEELPPEHPATALKALYKEMSDFVAAGAAPAGNSSAPPFGDSAAPPFGKSDDAPPIGEPPAEVPAPIVEPPVSPAPPADDVEKSDLKKRLADAEAIIKAERDTRALADMKTVLKSITTVAINPDADAPLFKRMQETDSVAYSRVMEILKGADAAGALSREIGSPLPGDKASGNVAWTTIEAEAETLRKSDPTGKITKHQAIDIIMKRRPDLVKQHNAEMGA